MQLDSGRGGSAQHILEWGIFGLVFRGKAGVLLLKDRQSQHITVRHREKEETDMTDSQQMCGTYEKGKKMGFYSWLNKSVELSLHLKHHVGFILVAT